MSEISAKDPVCGMSVEPGHEAARADHAGKTYLFCSPGCRDTFAKDPAKFAKGGAGEAPKKKRWGLFGIAVLALAGAGTGRAQGEAEPTPAEKVITIQGEIVDTTCYLRHEKKGTEHAKCALMCLRAGIPMGLLEDGTGKVYVFVSESHGNPHKDIEKYLLKKVKVTGALYERGGLSGIAARAITEL
ncbi:MAG: YHS domain-containing protein [Nitrospirae bacterium]|nr:YHS domain-containing protein [Nitrospirota bacterium]